MSNEMSAAIVGALITGPFVLAATLWWQHKVSVRIRKEKLENQAQALVTAAWALYKQRQLQEAVWGGYRARIPVAVMTLASGLSAFHPATRSREDLWRASADVAAPVYRVVYEWFRGSLTAGAAKQAYADALQAAMLPLMKSGGETVAKAAHAVTQVANDCPTGDRTALDARVVELLFVAVPNANATLMFRVRQAVKNPVTGSRRRPR